MIDSRCHKLLACILCSTIFLTIIPFNIGETVKADTIVNYEGEKPSSDCFYRSVEEAYFTAEVKTTKKWSGHSNIEIKFKNTGTEAIHDWYFTFDFNYKIENPFNCRVIESKDNLYTIGNNDWNQDVKPGQSVTVGFTAASKDGSEIKDMPSFYLLNTETVTLESGDLKYKYEEYSNWSSGFNGALILTNKTKETIRDWTITFGANRPITQVDSSVFTDNGDGTYTITNDGNNQNIAKGQSYRIGIQGGSNDPSKAFTLTDFTATAKKMALKLTDDKDKNGIADVLEVDFNGTITVTPTEAPTSTPTATSTPSATATPKATNSPTATPTATNTPTVKPTATNTPRPTATNTPTVKPTATNTPRPTATNTPTVKPTATNTPRPTATNTPTVKPTATNTPRPTVTNTPTVKPTATNTPRPTATNTPTVKPTATNTPRPTATNTPTVKPTNTAIPSVTVTPVSTATSTPVATPTPDVPVTPTSTVTNTPTPTTTNSPTPTISDSEYLSDADNDGLYYYEEMEYGTDPDKADTDDDGVSDKNEIKMSYNPLVKDTDGNGILDGDEDYDGDGITNRREESNGTCPYAKDTDYDDLNDYEELYVYYTDPDNEDTDGDYIIDGDEAVLGTNPKAKKTNNIFDNENAREYSFSSSSEQLTEFNKDNPPFNFSVDIKAAGVVSKYIEISETGYKNAISKNPYILGKSPCVSYDENMKVESITVRFTMQNGYDENINNYTIFYYWEGYNLLIPLKTYYDESAKTVFANNIYIGTYCLIDTNQMSVVLGEPTDKTADKIQKSQLLNAPLRASDFDEFTVGPVYYLNNKEYFLICSDTPMNYNEAISICTRYKGHPATIEDAAENSIVEHAANLNEVWIGGRIEKTGFLKYKINWVDGSAYSYDSWGNNIPIIALEGGEAIYSYMGLWFLLDPRSSLNAVVCERSRGADIGNYSGYDFTPDNRELNNKSDSDSDGDGIPDYLELSKNDLGTFDDKGAYKPASYSNYIDIAKQSGMPIDEVIKELFEGWGFTVSSYESDPDSADNDGDGYMDFEDGTPFEANKDMIFILYKSDDRDFVNEGRNLDKYYSNLGKYAMSFGFNDYKSFMRYWNSIGDKYIKGGLSSPTGMYYFNVTDVVIISHGSAYRSVEGVLMDLGNKEYLVADIKETIPSSRFHPIMDIGACRRFKSLDMMVCYSAFQGGRHYLNKSLADTFISHFKTIFEVYGFDCRSTLLVESGKMVWAGLEYIFNYPNVYDCPYKGQVLYYRETVGGQRYFINDLYPGNQDIYFHDYDTSKLRPVLNAAKNKYYDPVLR